MLGRHEFLPSVFRKQMGNIVTFGRVQIYLEEFGVRRFQ